MRSPLESYIRKSALLLAALLATTSVTAAQALITAGRGAEFAPFATATLIRPDWGTNSNLGYTVGVDYTRFIRSIVQPSLEIRMTGANGLVVNERTYTGGLKLQTSFHRVQPYATLLVGYGTIAFNYNNHGYQGDNSTVYSIGGGADVNVTSLWKVRFDFTDQNWNLGTNASLTPMTFGVGLSYSIPFHNGRVR